MYDEYYYYVEFDGNSFLAVAFSGILMFFNYLRISAWHFSVSAVILLVVPGLLCWFLWVSYRRALRDFFEDLRTTAATH